MKWRKGRLEDNGPDGLTQEYICEHGIGHWRWPHSCDQCCRRDDYPGNIRVDKQIVVKEDEE